MVVARTGDADNAYRVGRIMGDELRALGINLDLAPVLDTLTGSAERRYYGTTTNDAAQYGCAMARGLRDAGVLACGKHFPGHEQTGLDTHFGFVVDDTPSDLLMRCMTPFSPRYGGGTGQRNDRPRMLSCAGRIGHARVIVQTYHY